MACRCGHDNPPGAARCTRCGRRLVAGVPWAVVAQDLAVGLGLAAALAAVFLLDWGGVLGRSPTAAPQNARLEIVKAADGPPPALRPLRLGVTPHEYDDMARLLSTLGPGYRHDPLAMDDLLNADRLRPYDVVFATCAGMPRSWLARQVAPGLRDSAGTFQMRPQPRSELRTSLRTYVDNGGTLYASDWQYHLLAIAFPEFLDSKPVPRGAAQTVTAEVLDPALRRLLGDSVQLRFDEPDWRPAAFDPSKVTVLLEGQFADESNRRHTAPLLVQFAFGAGQVIFTSFHNEAQNSRMELQLLRSLVLATVTARADAAVKQTLLRGGFTATQRSLFTASQADQRVSDTYHCRGGTGLRFALALEDRGGLLQLSITAPDGRTWQQQGRSSFTIEVPDPPKGTWTYTITPLLLPYGNFPFTLTVGEK